MSFSAGVFSINSAGQPVVTGTVISSTAFNALTADLATGLSTCVLKDGTQTITANIPMATFKFTGLGAGTAAGNSLRYEQVNGVVTTAGDVLYAAGAGTLARLGVGTRGQKLTINSGATAPEWTNGITLGTEQTPVSGVEIDFTGIPAGVRRITIMLVGLSTNGTSPIYLQLGISSGIEGSGYLGAQSVSTNGVTTVNATSGMQIARSSSAGDLLNGSVILSLEDSSDNTWVAQFAIGLSNVAETSYGGFIKPLAGVLDRVRITTAGGTDTFDAGGINISYEF